MSKDKTILFIFLIFFILVISCEESEPIYDITNTNWMLQSIQYGNGDIIIIDNPSVYTIMFDDSSNIEGLADCNTCGGDFDIRNSSISIRFGCTKKGCGSSSKGWEYFLAVNSASSYKIVGRELQIFFDNDKSVLNFLWSAD